MSDRYPGGLIRKTPPTITPPVDGEGGSAPGIWTLEQASYYEGTGEWPKPVLARELYSAGKGIFGILGTDNTANSSSPVQIGSETIWDAISANYDTAMATKTNGELYYWGSGSNGRSGTGVESPDPVSSPVQIGALTNWSTMTVLSETIVAVKTDGTLWSWGGNSYGEQGRNNTANSSSPLCGRVFNKLGSSRFRSWRCGGCFKNRFNYLDMGPRSIWSVRAKHT